MADISQITFGSNTWDIKDAQARIDILNCTSTTVLPNDYGSIKTRFRIAYAGFTGSSSTTWYFPLVKFPVDNSNDAASLILSGRVGGWGSASTSYINALAWNRNSTGIAVLNIAGSASAMSTIWNLCDIVIYTNSDNSDTVYLKCKDYFLFDIDIEVYQNTSEIIYDGTYLTSTPSGTLNAQASTSTRRAELVNGDFIVAGKTVEVTNNKVTSLSSSSTDTQYPSAKCVYTLVGDIESALQALR